MENILNIIKKNLSSSKYREFSHEFNNYLIENSYYYDEINALEDNLTGNIENDDKIKFIEYNDLQNLAFRFFYIYVNNKYIEPFYMGKFIIKHKRVKHNKNLIPIVKVDFEEIDNSIAEINLEDIIKSYEGYEQKYIRGMEKSLQTIKGKNIDLNKVIIDITQKMNHIEQTTNPIELKNPKAFEYCILLIVLDALNSIEGVSDITPCDLDLTTGKFIIPGAPRQIYSLYSYYSFNYKKSSYEVHLGVRYKGSTSLHEADLSIIKRNHAEKSRSKYTNPKKDSLVAWFECKYYTGSLQIAESRELVGLKDDFLQNGIYYFVSNSSGESTKDYFSMPRRPDLYDNITFSGNSIPLDEFTKNITSDIRKRLIYLETSK